MSSSRSPGRRAGGIPTSKSGDDVEVDPLHRITFRCAKCGHEKTVDARKLGEQGAASLTDDALVERTAEAARALLDEILPEALRRLPRAQLERVLADRERALELGQLLLAAMLRP